MKYWASLAKVVVSHRAMIAVLAGLAASTFFIQSYSGGSGVLNFVDANGQTYSYNYFFYPISQLNLYADIPGRHTIYFIVGGTPSNQVVVDVAGTTTMTYAQQIITILR